MFQHGDNPMSKKEFMEEADWYLINVTGRPNAALKPEDGYWPVKRQDPRDPTVRTIDSWRDVFFQPKFIEGLKAAGMSDEDIEKKYQDWISGLVKTG